MNDADLELALRAVVFAAVGTAGQRCTTARRLVWKIWFRKEQFILTPIIVFTWGHSRQIIGSLGGGIQDSPDRRSFASWYSVWACAHQAGGRGV